jgi:mRNA interferase RelE/StbE
MPSAHRVEWTATAKRDLSRLPEKVATAVVEFIYSALAENPRRIGHELHLELAGRHSARRGSFRVIYIVDDDDRRVTITDVKQRGDVYRRS